MNDHAHSVGPYERFILLKAMTLSGNPPSEALAALAYQAEEQRLAAGDTIVAGGREWDHAGVVVEGRVGVYEDQHLLYTANAREPFGVLEVLARARGLIEVRAESDTIALRLRSQTITSVLEDHFVMTRDMIRSLCGSLLASPEWLAATPDRQRLPVLETPAGGHVDLIGRLALLHGSEIFARTRLDSLAELAAAYEEIRIGAGDTVWREEDASGWWMVLLEGRVDSSSASGLRFSWHRGSIPGLIEGLAGAPRWTNAVAGTPVTGLRLTADRFLDALEDDPQMAADVLAVVASRVLELKRAPHPPRLPAHGRQD